MSSKNSGQKHYILLCFLTTGFFFFVIMLICSLEVIHVHEEIGLALAVLLCRVWLWWEEINPLSFLGAFLYGRIMS